MDIFDALRLLKQGKKVRFHNWPKDEYVYLNDKLESVYNKYGGTVSWSCVIDELFLFGHEDKWEEYKEPQVMKEKTTKIVLWYPKEGEPLFNRKCFECEARKFVALDSAAGDYPYPVKGSNAHDFGTVEKAKDYAKMFPGLKVGQLVSYHEVTKI